MLLVVADCVILTPCVLHQATSRKRSSKNPKTTLESDGSSAVGGCSGGIANGPLERVSSISCECHQSAGRRRCSASPAPAGREGKENDPRMTVMEADGCRTNGGANKAELEEMECEESGCTLFPDDDSNQILPVEQFFGNMDVVQVRDFFLAAKIISKGRIFVKHICIDLSHF